MKAYYIDLGFKDVRIGMYDAFNFDKDGIPRYRYPSGLFYNITFVCHFALYHHSRYIKFGRQEERKAMKPFEVAVNDGGVQARFPDGGIAFEEYPGRQPNIVLNGFITALVGLYDLSEIGKAPRASELFTQGVRSLENNLHRYDLDYWSAYDLTGLVASPNYHLYHLMQLWALYEMTGYETFKRTTTKWQCYRKGPRFHVFHLLTRGCTRLWKYIP